LSTTHHWHEYIQAKFGHVAKFMPQFDSPFIVTKVNPSKSTYTLDLPNEPNQFPTFHSSQLWHFVPNDNELFPTCKLTQPGLVLTPDSEQKWLIDCVLDEWTWGRDRQFLVQGWGAKEDR
jgi:hypothetical protein